MKYFIYLSFLQMLLINLVVSSHVTFLKNKTKTTSVTAKSISNSTSENEEMNESRLHSGYCLMKINNYFYDLTPLWAKDMKSAYKTFTKSGELINFNICGRNAPSICSNKQAMTISNIRCTEFSGDIEKDRIWTLSSNINKKSVLTLRLPHGEICKQKGPRPEFYRTSYEFTCSETKTFEINKDCEP